MQTISSFIRFAEAGFLLAWPLELAYSVTIVAAFYVGGQAVKVLRLRSYQEFVVSAVILFFFVLILMLANAYHQAGLFAGGILIATALGAWARRSEKEKRLIKLKYLNGFSTAETQKQCNKAKERFVSRADPKHKQRIEQVWRDKSHLIVYGKRIVGFASRQIDKDPHLVLKRDYAGLRAHIVKMMVKESANPRPSSAIHAVRQQEAA